MSRDDNIKVSIRLLGLDVQHQNWRFSIEGVLMRKGLIRYIRDPPLPDIAVTADVDKRTQAFGFILRFLAYLSFSERQASDAILTANTQDAHALWTDIKHRHEKVEMSRVWAYWRRLNAPPTVTLSDRAAINT